MRSVLNELNDSGFRAVQIGNTIYVDVRDWIPFDEEVDKVVRIVNRRMPKETVVIQKPLEVNFL